MEVITSPSHEFLRVRVSRINIPENLCKEIPEDSCLGAIQDIKLIKFLKPCLSLKHVLIVISNKA